MYPHHTPCVPVLICVCLYNVRTSEGKYRSFNCFGSFGFGMIRVLR